ncbi:MAG: hypothetical protein JWO31_3421, partial [Phycisphaerales bacterium]|nr:hypothetical protein [Phycisphaerales bacterium]
AAGRPTLLAVARDVDAGGVPALSSAAGRTDARYGVEQRAYAVLVVDAAGLLAPTVRPEGAGSPYLRFVASPNASAPAGVPSPNSIAASSPTSPVPPAAAFAFAGGRFTLDVTVPLPEPARLTVSIRPAAAGAAGGLPTPVRRVRCVVRGAGEDPVEFPAADFAGTCRYAVPLGRADNAARPRRTVRVELVPVDGGPQATLAGELVDATLDVVPPLPSAFDAKDLR